MRCSRGQTVAEVAHVHGMRYCGTVTLKKLKSPPFQVMACGAMRAAHVYEVMRDDKRIDKMVLYRRVDADSGVRTYRAYNIIGISGIDARDYLPGTMYAHGDEYPGKDAIDLTRYLLNEHNKMEQQDGQRRERELAFKVASAGVSHRKRSVKA